MKFKVTSFIICFFVFILTIGNLFYSQVKEIQPPQKKEANYQTWKLPIYMQENLQWMLDDFNKRFEEKVQSYKKELQDRFAEFKDMPDDAVLYLEGGIFINRADFIKLQRYMRNIEELRNKQKMEVKKDGK